MPKFILEKLRKMKIISSLALVSSAYAGIICKGAAYNYYDCQAKCQISIKCLWEIVGGGDLHQICEKQGRKFKLVDQIKSWKGEKYVVANNLDHDTVTLIIDRYTRSKLGRGNDVQLRISHMCEELPPWWASQFKQPTSDAAESEESSEEDTVSDDVAEA